MFIGIPNMSRWKKRPITFITTARLRMKNRSSNSRYRNLTFVARFRGTVVTVSAMCRPFFFACPPSAHACRALVHEKLPQPHEPGNEEAQDRSEEISCVVQLVMR